MSGWQCEGNPYIRHLSDGTLLMALCSGGDWFWQHAHVDEGEIAGSDAFGCRFDAMEAGDQYAWLAGYRPPLTEAMEKADYWAHARANP